MRSGCASAPQQRGKPSMRRRPKRPYASRQRRYGRDHQATLSRLRPGFPGTFGEVISYRCPCCVKLLLGPYCHLEWIGGGMGDVYRAREPGSGHRAVAIKVPKTDRDPQLAKRRFQREIAASARLAHESAVRACQRGGGKWAPISGDGVRRRLRVCTHGRSANLPRRSLPTRRVLLAPARRRLLRPRLPMCPLRTCPCPRSQAPPGNGPFWQAPPAVLVLDGLRRGRASR